MVSHLISLILLNYTNAKLIGATAAIIIGWRTKNLLATIIGKMLTFLALHLHGTGRLGESSIVKIHNHPATMQRHLFYLAMVVERVLVFLKIEIVLPLLRFLPTSLD